MAIGQPRGEKDLVLVVDQAGKAVSGAQAPSAVVVSKVDNTTVRGNAGSGSIIESLVAARDFTDYSLRFAD